MKINNKVNFFNKKNLQAMKKTDSADDFLYHLKIYQGKYHTKWDKPLLLGLEREFKFCKSRKFRFDFAYTDKKVAVECDGGQWLPNGGRHNRDSDREKLNIAASLGWKVFRFSSQQVKNEPQQCCDLIYETLYMELKK